jgi:hypothetical protein
MRGRRFSRDEIPPELAEAEDDVVESRLELAVPGDDVVDS